MSNPSVLGLANHVKLKFTWVWQNTFEPIELINHNSQIGPSIEHQTEHQ